jgi:hypothetical protein
MPEPASRIATAEFELRLRAAREAGMVAGWRMDRGESRTPERARRYWTIALPDGDVMTFEAGRLDAFLIGLETAEVDA